MSMRINYKFLFRINANIQKATVFIIAGMLMAGCVANFNTPGSGAKTEEFVKGKVAKGFPNDIPLYKGAVVVESYGGSGGFGASFIADDSLNKVFNFYNLALPKLGWTAQAKKQSDTNFVFEIKNDKETGQVIVNTAADGKKTAITISITNR